MHAPAVLHLEEAHGLDAALALLTFVMGAVGLALVAAGIDRAGMACGAVGVVSGMWGQLVSRTRSERFFDVVGLVAAAVAFALGAAFGDLTFSG
jgi:hypothetical protein